MAVSRHCYNWEEPLDMQMIVNVCPGLHVFYSNLLLTHNFSHCTVMERGERSLLPENFIKQSWYHFIVNANLELDVKGQG